MLRDLAVRCAVFVGLLLLAPTFASAATYNFTGGSMSLRAELAGTSTSVIEPGAADPVILNLGGSFVEFDLGTNTLTGLELIPTGTFVLDLDQTVVGLDIVEVSNAMLVEAPGATALVSGAGSFNIATIMSGDVQAVGAPPPPTYYESTNSSTGGSLFVSGTQLDLAIFGVTLATFDAPMGQTIDVKADFTFFGVVPEPGTALLLGLGLAGLSAAGRRTEQR